MSHPAWAFTYPYWNDPWVWLAFVIVPAAVAYVAVRFGTLGRKVSP